MITGVALSIAAAAATKNVAAWTAEGGRPHMTSRPPPRLWPSPYTITTQHQNLDSRGGCRDVVRSRTLTFLEKDWTHTGAIYGVDPGADEGTRNLGAVCDCVCRQRAAGHAGGFYRRDLCVAGSQAAT